MKISINQIVSLQKAAMLVEKWIYERKEAVNDMKGPCPPESVLQAMNVISRFVGDLGTIEVNVKA